MTERKELSEAAMKALAGGAEAKPAQDRPAQTTQPIVPNYVMEALWAYDVAMRDHLRDCWLGNADVGDINKHYAEVRARKEMFERYLSDWVSRHAAEFSAEAAARRVP